MKNFRFFPFQIAFLKLSQVFFFIIILVVFLIACALDPPDPEGDQQENPPADPGPNDPSSNRSPIANAGEDQTLLIINAMNISIDGSNSSDPDGDPLTYSWHVLGENIDLEFDQVSFTIDLPSAGEFYFVLIVDDGKVISEPDVLTITVVAPDGWVDDDFPVDDIARSEFTTIQRAIDELGANSIIVVRPGSYEENITIEAGIHLFGFTSQDEIIPEIHASLENTDERRSVVELRGQSIIENFLISGETSPIEDYSLSIVNVSESSTGATIRKCIIRTADDNQNHYVDGVAVRSNAQLLIDEGSILYSISGEGIVAYQDADLTVENSRIGHSGGSLVYTIQSANAAFYNCVFHNAGYDGLDLSGQYIDIDHCTIAFFNNNGININAPSEWNLTNTLVYSDADSPSFYAGAISPDTVETNNLPNSDPESYADPMFVDAENGNFNLQPGSPAIGSGENGEDVGAIGDVLSP